MSNPENKDQPAVERRKKVRFAISPSFPLKAALALPGENDSAWRDWPGTLVDLSVAGAHVQVSLAAIAYPEGQCRLKLSLGTFKVEIPGTIAHFVGSSRLAVCGLQLYFHDPGVEKAYLRVLEPAMIGASLAPIDASQEYSIRYKEEYAGKPSARLTVWRESRGAAISGFDFRMNRFGVEADREPGADPTTKLVLKCKLSGADEPAGGGGRGTLTGAQEQEVRWQYRLAVCNFSKVVPADVQTLLRSLV